MNRGTSAVNAWTPEREETTRIMWVDGHSAQQIAKALACGLTRNAVIGKIHRKGWDKRDVVRAPQANNGTWVNGKKPPKERRPAQVTRRGFSFGGGGSRVVKAPKPEPVEEPIGDVIPMEKLTNFTCKWPIGDPQEASFGFCGCVKQVELPYCTWHQGKAYTHVPKPARVRSHAETDEKLRQARRWAA